MRFSLLAAVAAVAASVFIAIPAVAATDPSNEPGADISWPQCGGPLPAGQRFGIVGVNDGLGNTTNPCLSDELDWAATSAGGTGQPLTSLYVMAQDPGLLASWWPNSDQTRDGTPVAVPARYGVCTATEGGTLGQESAACAFVYGYDMAEEDVTSRGVANPAVYRWWIDVEMTNTWALSPDANAADLEGMVAAFQAAHAAVGLYSTPYQWHTIAGVTATDSPLTGLPSWIASIGSVGAAETNCYISGLTPGSSVTLAQYQTGGFDADLACNRLSASPTPTISGTAAVDQTLAAHAGTWTAGVGLRYQWLRGTSVIRGATSGTYRTTSADAGRALSVAVTGTKTGYTTITRTSRSTSIPVPVSRLTASHTLAAGKSLLAPNGRYRLIQRSDGDLVLYKDTGKALWSSHRFGRGYTTTMQTDGNLVTYTPTHHAVWATGTNGKHATYAVMQSDGNFVLYAASGKAVWATHTNGQ